MTKPLARGLPHSGQNSALSGSGTPQYKHPFALVVFLTFPARSMLTAASSSLPQSGQNFELSGSSGPPQYRHLFVIAAAWCDGWLALCAEPTRYIYLFAMVVLLLSVGILVGGAMKPSFNSVSGWRATTRRPTNSTSRYSNQAGSAHREKSSRHTSLSIRDTIHWAVHRSITTLVITSQGGHNSRSIPWKSAALKSVVS